MKKMIFLLLAGTLASCGEKTKIDVNSEEIEKRELTPELEKLINDLANCDAQNTNCDAYMLASKEIPVLTQDDTKRQVIIEDLVYIIRTGENTNIQAAAHALNFWTGSHDYKENTSYGVSILEALKNIVESDKEYGSTGAQTGQLLAQWWTNEDENLRSQLIAFISDKNGNSSGRSELIRLVSKDILDNDKVFDALMAVIKDSEGDKTIRNYAISSLSMVKNDDNKTNVRVTLEGMLDDSEFIVAGNAMKGLGYLGAIESLDKVSATIRAHKDDKSWYSYASTCLRDLILKNNETIDKDQVFELISEMISYKSINAYSRSWYIMALHQLKTPSSKALMTKLKSSNEEDIAKEALRVSKF